MKFTIELVVSTGDNDKYHIAGYLSPETGEEELMQSMIKYLKESMEQSIIEFDNHILFKEDKIIYNDIPIVACSNIFKLFEGSFKIKIHTEIVSNAKFIPEGCRPLFQMEINRLFN